MNASLDPVPSTLPLSAHLKAATRETHERLDKRLMAYDLFASRTRFAQFVSVQHRFHQCVDGLHRRTDLAVLLPGLAARNRVALTAADLADLGQPAPHEALRHGDALPLPVALGWLYVAEGSRLGGAVLFKLASQKLALGADFGARHLALPEEGVASHWRAFSQALDAVTLTDAEREQAVAAANEAFRTVQGFVNEVFDTAPAVNA